MVLLNHVESFVALFDTREHASPLWGSIISFTKYILKIRLFIIRWESLYLLNMQLFCPHDKLQDWLWTVFSYNRSFSHSDLDMPFAKWTKDQVCSWLVEQGLGSYLNSGKHWIASGQTLLQASQQDLEKVNASILFIQWRQKMWT